MSAAVPLESHVSSSTFGESHVSSTIQAHTTCIQLTRPPHHEQHTITTIAKPTTSTQTSPPTTANFNPCIVSGSRADWHDTVSAHRICKGKASTTHSDTCHTHHPEQPPQEHNVDPPGTTTSHQLAHDETNNSSSNMKLGLGIELISSKKPLITTLRCLPQK